MSTGIVICDDYVSVNTFNISISTTIDDHCYIISSVDDSYNFIQIPKQQHSFTPPHKKNRRGKFKRNGK